MNEFLEKLLFSKLKNTLALAFKFLFKNIFPIDNRHSRNTFGLQLLLQTVKLSVVF